MRMVESTVQKVVGTRGKVITPQLGTHSLILKLPLLSFCADEFSQELSSWDLSQQFPFPCVWRGEVDYSSGPVLDTSHLHNPQHMFDIFVRLLCCPTPTSHWPCSFPYQCLRGVRQSTRWLKTTGTCSFTFHNPGFPPIQSALAGISLQPLLSRGLFSLSFFFFF